MSTYASEPRTDNNPLYRSVSLWEMENIFSIGGIIGRESLFWLDPREECGLFFGEELAYVVHNGNDFRRYVGSTPEFNYALWQKRQLEEEKETYEDDEYEEIEDRINKIDSVFGEYMNIILTRLKYIKEALPATSYIVEVDMPGGLRYTDEESLSMYPEVCFPPGKFIPISQITAIYPVKNKTILDPENISTMELEVPYLGKILSEFKEIIDKIVA